MTNADEVTDWLQAIDAFQTCQYEDAILKFSGLNPNAKIMFNIGCCFYCLRDHSHAIQKLNHALSMDNHLAIAHFLQAEIHYIEQRLSAAFKSYEKAHEKLRGKSFIDYRPIGLKHVMYEWQVIANEIIVSSKLNQGHTSIVNLKDHSQQSYIQEILHSIKENRSAEIVKFLPMALFQPPKGNAENINKKNYLGQATVVSTANTEEIYSGFSGVKIKEKPSPTISKRSPPNRPTPPRPIPRTRSPPVPKSRKNINSIFTVETNNIMIGSHSSVQQQQNSPVKPIRPLMNNKTQSVQRDDNKLVQPSKLKHHTSEVQEENNNFVNSPKPLRVQKSTPAKPIPFHKPTITKDKDNKLRTTENLHGINSKPLRSVNHGQDSIAAQINKQLLRQSYSVHTTSDKAPDHDWKLRKQQSLCSNGTSPPQKPLPVMQKKERPIIPPSPKLTSKALTPPMKPKRPPRPTLVTKQAESVSDEHIYETPELNQANDGDEMKLEKTMYGNIFCEVSKHQRQTSPPKKPLPMLRKY